MRRSGFHPALSIAVCMLMTLAIPAVLVGGLPASAEARVTRIVITRVESPTFGGVSFGSVGQYEKIVGRAFGEVDPANPLNAGIVNIDKAPKNAAGRVEYAVDIYLLKPVDLNRGNGRIFYNVLNRGNKQALDNFNDTPAGANANEPASATDAGNGFLMRQGYVILWSAWQGDVPAGSNRMLASFPVATDGGVPIVAMNRDEFIFDNTTNPATATLSYPASTLDQTQATLTVRQREADPRVPLPASEWSYLSATRIRIMRPAAFDAGAIYEFIYPARDPIVMGLGFAAMRDVVAFLRQEAADDVGTPNPLSMESEKPEIERVLAFGSSQAGRYLRDMLWQGFMEDEGGRRVFDGIIPHKPGSRKTFTNFAFSQPGRFSRQHEDHLYGGDQFPFTYAVRFDSVSGKMDDILARCLASDTCPKTMHTDSGTEHWGARASLVVTDEHGNDIPLPGNVRVYLFASTQHGPARTPARGICQQLSNPAPFSPALRALLVALDRWASDGERPPASRVPRVSDGTLVPSLPQAVQGFPAIPGVVYSGLLNQLAELDASVQPAAPIPGHDYVVLVPKVDADGNDVAGIRLPEIAVPLATHTGWNLRRAGFAEGEICSLTGSFIPFANTKADRLATGDPRLSIEERYPSHEKYVKAVERAAKRLHEQRLLLEEDVERYIEAAEASSIGNP